MNITPIPCRRDDMLTVSRNGDILTFNDEVLDFAALPDGATLPQSATGCDWIAGDVTRTGGVLSVPIILPHGANAPEATRFPAPINVTTDGPVALPPYSEDAA